MEHPAHDDLSHDAEHVGQVDADLADELAPDEPKTPLWLTALGGVLFLLLAIVWLAARPNEPATGDLAAAVSASASAVASAPSPPRAVAPPAPPPPPPPAAPVVSAAGSARGGSPAVKGSKAIKNVKP